MGPTAGAPASSRDALPAGGTGRARPFLLVALVLALAVSEARAGKKKRVAGPPKVVAADPTPPPPPDHLARWEEALGEARDAGTRFDLEALAYVVTTFKIDVDLSLLAAVDEPRRARLIRHLAADPRWRLVEHQGALVAFRQVEDAHGWSVPLDGYHVDEHHAWRSALRFTPWDESSPWAGSPLVSRAKITDQRLAVKAFRLGSHRDSWEAVALTWQSDGFAFELFEARPQTTLEQVSRELASIQSVVEIATLDATDTRGFSPAGMPAGHPSAAEGVGVGYRDGILDVRAWARPPGFGVTWVRLYDAAGLPWEADAVARGTREITGWSPEPVSFAMQGFAEVESPPPAGLNAELWHLPHGSSKVQRLGAWPVTSF